MISQAKVQDELQKGEDLSIVNLVDSLIEYAFKSRASDIHIDPIENSIRLRVRVDGVLQDSFALPKEIASEVIARIKVLAGLRTDEHQAAQDGRFRIMLPEAGAIDVRVSIVPTYHGENAVLRLLADKEEDFTLDTLGFSDNDKEKILYALKRSHGMILCTGPTGSGKTTTLYNLIKRLNSKEVSIITVEDPIEYAISGVEQIQVNPNAGLTFATGLRSLLRQDPDIIMVGEIRDRDTATIAVNTALTGHLLLSTLHTNDAPTALPRLLDMGMEPYLVASTVNLVIGQRLVRRICDHCKTDRQLSELEIQSLRNMVGDKLDQLGTTVKHGKGCEKCGGTGYSGRIGIHEVLVVDDEIREAVLKKVSSNELKKVACKNGMTTMVESGLSKVKQGETTIEEILRVIHD